MSFSGFIEKWKKTGASERANLQPFLIELIELLDLEAVTGATATSKGDDYTFERPVKNRITGTTNFIDLYRRGCFVLEGKQGSDKKSKPKNTLQQELKLGEYLPKDNRTGTAVRGTSAWLKEMVKAREQAEKYARNLEADQGLPPFIIVLDVGYVMELYADFGGQGKYEQYPNKNEYRIYMDDLEKEEVQNLLRTIWNDPFSLDKSKYAAVVTREVAAELAELGKSYANEGVDDETVAKFLMRCLFTMFAEDVDLIPRLSFENLLREAREKKAHKGVPKLLEELWTQMDKGGFSTSIMADLMRFNGGLFREDDGGTIKALPVNEVQLGLLIRAAEKDWTNVEPSIFGTLLERALSPKTRHKLGAHYTPRPYVERLVVPTIMEPLRADFDAVKAAAMSRLDKGDADEARKIIKDFHHKLCTIRVLDPACGSGNFLYVSMDRMKRLEGDVLSFLEDLGEDTPRLLLQGETIDPHQFLGIEINPWAVWAAELVLWIGFLQWHFKTFGQAAPSEPVLKDFHNIEKRDALLEWKAREPRYDDDGSAITRWDGESYVKSNVTGENIPDPQARVGVYDYSEPKIAVWPQADFIIGNPPFIGGSMMPSELGEGYTVALRSAYKHLPDGIDLVMYWWDKAALETRKYKAPTTKRKASGTRRFGFITTNSIRQSLNRRILEPYLAHKKSPISIKYAVSDHPWVDSKDGAAVRISMTVANKSKSDGRLLEIISESKNDDEVSGRNVSFQEKFGTIFSNLQTGVDVTKAKRLRSNKNIAFRGIYLFGDGFSISEGEAKSFGVGKEANISKYIRPLYNGTDLRNGFSKKWVIDFWPLPEKDILDNFPDVYQYLSDSVKKYRAENNNPWRRENWFYLGDPAKNMRPSLEPLDYYFATIMTSPHRLFVKVEKPKTTDQGCITICLSDFSLMAVLSSNIHKMWALATGARLGKGNDPRYNNSLCFDPFPFPDLTESPSLRTRLSDLGERLDEHRKVRQKAHPKLTLTKMYNVLEKVKSDKVIEGKDKLIYKQGLIGNLKQIHDEIDALTLDAYGWSNRLGKEEILQRLLDLNHKRALDEAKGQTRWLRPEYQNPDGQSAKAQSGELELEDASLPDAISWPKSLPEQMAAIKQALLDAGQANVEDIRSQFKYAKTNTVKERLDTLAALGQAELLEDGRYAA